MFVFWAVVVVAGLVGVVVGVPAVGGAGVVGAVLVGA